MTKNKNPAAVGTADGAGHALAVKRCDPFSNLTTRQTEYWLGSATQFIRKKGLGGKSEVTDIIWLSPPHNGDWVLIEDNHGRSGPARNKRRRRSWRGS